MDDNKMMITDESGAEREVEIILTFDHEESGKKYVLFRDCEADSDLVYAYTYNEDGEMEEVATDEEWEMCQEVLGAFIEENDDDK